MMLKKKKRCRLAESLPICCFESRYSRLYRDIAGMGAQGIGHDTARARPQYGRACTTIRRVVRAIRPAARARALAGGECCDKKFCIKTGAQAWPLGVVSRYSLCIMTGRWAVWLARRVTIQTIVS